MTKEPVRWWRAVGGTIEPVEIIAADEKTVIRLSEGRQIRSRRAKGGVFYCPDWEEARRCLLNWNQKKAEVAQKELERTRGWQSAWMQYQYHKAEARLKSCQRHQKWLEALEPPATP